MSVDNHTPLACLSSAIDYNDFTHSKHNNITCRECNKTNSVKFTHSLISNLESLQTNNIMSVPIKDLAKFYISISSRTPCINKRAI